MILNKATDVISLPDEKGKLYRFVVTCGIKGRAFEIKASDQRTKSEWIHAIKEVHINSLIYLHIRIYTNIHICIYTCMCVPMYACMYVFMYVRIYVCMYV